MIHCQRQRPVSLSLQLRVPFVHRPTPARTRAPRYRNAACAREVNASEGGTELKLDAGEVSVWLAREDELVVRDELGDGAGDGIVVGEIERCRIRPAHRRVILLQGSERDVVRCRSSQFGPVVASEAEVTIPEHLHKNRVERRPIDAVENRRKAHSISSAGAGDTDLGPPEPFRRQPHADEPA